MHISLIHVKNRLEARKNIYWRYSPIGWAAFTKGCEKDQFFIDFQRYTKSHYSTQIDPKSTNVIDVIPTHVKFRFF